MDFIFKLCLIFVILKVVPAKSIRNDTDEDNRMELMESSMEKMEQRILNLTNEVTKLSKSKKFIFNVEALHHWHTYALHLIHIILTIYRTADFNSKKSKVHLVLKVGSFSVIPYLYGDLVRIAKCLKNTDVEHTNLYMFIKF